MQQPRGTCAELLGALVRAGGARRATNFGPVGATLFTEIARALGLDVV
jgi:hypothetical protein